jgi:endogenous inhibitor of DNA gyrase (YacG/DUF329 family)
MPMAVCPICKRALSPEGAATRPFCSARCRAADLGSWLTGHYRLSTAVDEAEDEAVSALEPGEDDGS